MLLLLEVVEVGMLLLLEVVVEVGMLLLLEVGDCRGVLGAGGGRLGHLRPWPERPAWHA